MNKFTSREFIEYYEDDLFWKTRFSESELMNFQKALTAQGYAAQLLQSPSALEGEIIKRMWFKIINQLEFSKLPKGKKYLFVDSAFTSNKGNDPTALLLCSLINGNIYIIKVEEIWLEFYQLIDKLKEYILLYQINRVYIEPKGTGITIIQELKRQIRTATIIKIDATVKSKIERVNSITNYLRKERVLLVEDGWNEILLNQIASFPYGVHDDLTDTLTYAVLNLIVGRWVSRTTEERIYDDREDFDLYAEKY